MKLTFLGTRGMIDGRNERHSMHASLRVEYRGKGAMIDCGEDWIGRLDEVRPKAILLTHAHPDHAFGLRGGAPCPVWATEETWDRLEDFPVADRRIVRPREPTEIRGITFEAFEVQHSIRAPAVGYRVTAGRNTVFYVPDLVYIHERDEALAGARVYIGDGACVEESLVRREGDRLFGHTPVRTQLTWCAKFGVPKMIVSHCGEKIVSEERTAREKIEAFARERGVEVEVAYDGMEVVLR